MKINRTFKKIIREGCENNHDYEKNRYCEEQLFQLPKAQENA